MLPHTSAEAFPRNDFRNRGQVHTLAAVTLLLPVGMALTILRIARQPARRRTTLLHGLAAVFVLQSCAVLATAGLLPLRLWS